MSKKEKEVQQRRVLEYQHFDLIRFKISDEHAKVTFYEFGNEHVLTPKEFIHPDLRSTVDQLKLYMAQRLGLLDGWDFARDKMKSDSDALRIAVIVTKKQSPVAMSMDLLLLAMAKRPVFKLRDL